ncbi:hypothetical protein pb186bvf_013755 [Paramecium bursaria]
MYQHQIQIGHRSKEPLSEILENPVQRNQKSDLKPQTAEDLSQMLTGITSLLEKNLQESHQLQQLIGVRDDIKSTSQNDFIVNDDGVDKLSSQIKENDKKLFIQQNQRLLQKIDNLNDKINDLERQIDIKLNEEKKLITLINQTSCIQKISYKLDENEQYFDDGVFVIQDNCLLLHNDYYSDYVIAFTLNQIDKITYKPDFQIYIEYKGDLLILQMDNSGDFQKVDLALWSHLRLLQAENRFKLFDNPIFESPFIKETRVDNQKKIKDQIKLIVNLQEIDRSSKIVSAKKHTEGVQTSLPPSPRASNNNPPIQQPPGQLLISTSPDDQAKVQNALQLLKQGFSMVKYSSKQRKPNQRVIYLTSNNQILKWKEPLQPYDKKESQKERAIALSTIKDIKDVAEGPGFQKFTKSRQGKEYLGITIIADRILELDATCVEDKTLFVECMKLALKKR